MRKSFGMSWIIGIGCILTLLVNVMTIVTYPSPLISSKMTRFVHWLGSYVGPEVLAKRLRRSVNSCEQIICAIVWIARTSSGTLGGR
jgi:hypothetical protein